MSSSESSPRNCRSGSVESVRFSLELLDHPELLERSRRGGKPRPQAQQDDAAQFSGPVRVLVKDGKALCSEGARLAGAARRGGRMSASYFFAHTFSLITRRAGWSVVPAHRVSRRLRPACRPPTTTRLQRCRDATEQG